MKKGVITKTAPFLVSLDMGRSENLSVVSCMVNKRKRCAHNQFSRYLYVPEFVDWRMLYPMDYSSAVMNPQIKSLFSDIY